MVKLEAAVRPFRIIPCALIAATLCLLAGCGGGTTSAPYAGPSTSSGGGTGSGTGSGGGSNGGGGATGAASPFILFGSTYVAYSAQTNGAYLHSLQGGDVYTAQGGSWFYSATNGGYSSPQAAMNNTGLYIFQEKAGTAAPTTSADFLQVAVSAPGDGTVDISQAANLVIQMGNSVTPASAVGNANVFTVEISNQVGSTAPTGDCTFNQTLSEVGANVAGPPGSALGVRTYVIPLSSFSCATGTLATLQSSGITVVAVKILGAHNPNLVANEIDNINIGMIGFTTTVTSADTAALAE